MQQYIKMKRYEGKSLENLHRDATLKILEYCVGEKMKENCSGRREK